MSSATGTASKSSRPAVRRSTSTIGSATNPARYGSVTTDCASRSGNRSSASTGSRRDVRTNNGGTRHLCGRSDRLIRAAIDEEGRNRHGTCTEESRSRVVCRVANLNGRGVGRPDLNDAIGTSATTARRPTVACVHDSVSAVTGCGTSRPKTADTASESGVRSVRAGNSRMRGTTGTCRERRCTTCGSRPRTVRGTADTTGHRESTAERTSSDTNSGGTSTCRDRNRNADRASTSRLSSRS
jgi:hypothetical protein